MIIDSHCHIPLISKNKSASIQDRARQSLVKIAFFVFLASPGFVFYSPGHGDGADGFQSAVRPCQDEGQELRRRPVGRGGRLPVRHGQVSSYLGE